MKTFTIDHMIVHMLNSNEALGQRAADDFATLISQISDKQGHATAILATGNSQLTFFSSLVKKSIPWDEVTVFHMDEYLGMSDQHPASFARYIRERLVDYVHPAAFYPMRGDSSDVEKELTRYSGLIRKFSPDVCVLGIGENGHLAFNDPPADFDTKEVVHIVNLDLRCRQQQVNEGHFPTIDDVPKQAITLTVPALLSVRNVLAVVPEGRKAAAVKAALEGPVTEDYPASILRTKSHVTMYLDGESSSSLSMLRESDRDHA